MDGSEKNDADLWQVGCVILVIFLGILTGLSFWGLAVYNHMNAPVNHNPKAGWVSVSNYQEECSGMTMIIERDQGFSHSIADVPNAPECQ